MDVPERMPIEIASEESNWRIMSFDGKTLGDDEFTILPFNSLTKKKFNGGIITLWVFAFVSLVLGIWQMTLGSPKECKDTACSLGQVTSLSIGLMGICMAGFMALLGFMLMIRLGKQEEEKRIKEEEILKQALIETRGETPIEKEKEE